MQEKDQLAELFEGQNDGCVTFADFMRFSLYHPQCGYYRQENSPIGPHGDFYTAVSATPVFGRILAHYFARLRSEMRHEDFEVVEFGGHRGRLHDDVLKEVPDLRYRVIDLDDPEPETITGCVFSNEFLDALPVHRVKVVNGRWQEKYVTRKDGHLGWETGPLSEPKLDVILSQLPVVQMEGYETEVNIKALDWMERIGRTLNAGYVVTIDYGFERHNYFSPQRPQGTLRCYYQHTMNDNPLQHIGRQDITAHVEFTSLIEAGQRVGFEPVLLTDLSHFLIKEGEPVLREITERTAGTISRERQGLHQLLHPGLMGSNFKVLVQRKPRETRGEHSTSNFQHSTFK